MNQCRMTDLATAVNNGNRIIVTVKKVRLRCEIRLFVLKELEHFFKDSGGMFRIPQTAYILSSAVIR